MITAEGNPLKEAENRKRLREVVWEELSVNLMSLKKINKSNLV